MAVDALARSLAAGKVPVDAYEMAVAGGYTGTKEQFEADLGQSGTNATNAANSAAAAAASATTASNAASNFAPTYSTSATYAVGDYVLYNSGLYECNTAITTAEAWTAAHWTAVKVGPEMTALRNGLVSVLASDATTISGTTENHADLDNYRTPGNYKVLYPQYVDHGPSSAASYRLLVLETINSSRFAQIAILNTGSDSASKLFIRTDGGGGWTSWMGMASTSALNTLNDTIQTLEESYFALDNTYTTRIQPTSENPVDLNDYTTPGNYRVLYTTELPYISNSPSTDTTYRFVVMKTSANDRFMQIAFINDAGDGRKIAVRNRVSSGWKSWQYLADASDVAAIEKIVSSKNTYNLLDTENMIVINSYINNTTNKLLHSTGNVKTLALAVTAGKTYTFSRKNAGSRLILGCGTALWTDDNDHDLLNTVYSSDNTTYGTITVPTGGNYLYVFYYRAASDSNYNATIEEAMIVEGTVIPEYAPHTVLDVEKYMLPDDVVSDIAKGVTAYNTSAASLNRWSTRSMTFGVEFNLASSAPAGTRIADAFGRNSSDFDDIFPWCDMRRCKITVSNGKKSIIYDGDANFDNNGGDVFVEIPAFYVCREKIGSNEKWLISGTEKGGFELHPWFKNEDGTKAEFRYYGAYKASVSSGVVKSVSGALPYNHGSENFEAFMTSLSGTGYKRNDIYALSALQFLFVIEYATRNGQSIYNGSTYNPYFGTASPTYDLEAIISITNNQIKLAKGSQVSGNSFAYYSAGMQVYIGTSTSDGFVRNVTAITTDSDYVYITVDGAAITFTSGLRCAGCAQKTGKTDGLETPSGYADEDSHVAAFRYRYIENPWGTIWEVLDGLKAQNNAWYITTPSHYRESALTNWEALGYTYQVPASAPSTTDHSSDNWIQEMGFDTDHRAIALPETVFTDSGTTVDISTDAGVLVRSGVTIRGQQYYCDAFYNNTNSSLTVPTIGGGWDHHENAGPFCMRMLTATTTAWLYGERLTC